MIQISFPKPADLMNLNDRQHHMAKHTLNSTWKEAARLAAINHKNQGKPLPPTGTLTGVRCTFPVKRATQRRDGHNFVATVKPILDGFTAAGVWEDDDTSRVVLFDSGFQDETNDVYVALWTISIGAAT